MRTPLLFAGWLGAAMVAAAAAQPDTADDDFLRALVGRDYIAHWLDRVGAAGARVVASGKRDGDRLVIVFPYPEGAFRDTFTRDRASNGWTLLIEAQAADGTWSTFARYAFHARP